MKIEKNIEMPKAQGGRPAKWAAIDEMQVGDSLLLESEALVHKARFAMYHRGFKPSFRKLTDGTGWRIWRTE